MSTSSGASRRNKSAAGQTGTQTGKKPGYYSTRYGVGAASTGARKEPGKPAKPGDAGYEKAQHDRRYIPALDGLRALAVLGVIAYHLGSAHVHGGLLGVTVFFVLSGYLITGILVNEYRESSTINLPKFWLRRVRRLFPAIFVVVFVVAALCVLFNHALLTKMRPDIIPSLFWFQNWWYVFRQPRRALAAHALLVARHRGAVLRRVAARAAARVQAGRQAQGARPCVPWPCGGIDAAHGASL